MIFGICEFRQITKYSSESDGFSKDVWHNFCDVK
jgi:hypothetical protein